MTNVAPPTASYRLKWSMGLIGSFQLRWAPRPFGAGSGYRLKLSIAARTSLFVRMPFCRSSRYTAKSCR
jgi:hypothetical protein